jgi:SAM-dependent methyltransferase
MTNNQKEENPFETPQVAAEWITSVENEKGLLRDNEIYPYLKKWVSKVSPKVLVEIGAGQGICSDKIGDENFTTYIGIEPSVYLVDRALFLYTKPNKKFVVGNAYDLPFKNKQVDAAFSVNVWFHLADIRRAGSELSRILKTKGQFLIITANPKAKNTWESFFLEKEKEGNKITGKIAVPVNPLSSSVIFEYTLDELTHSLESNSLHITKTDELGRVEGEPHPLFIAISGERYDMPLVLIPPSNP